LYGDTSAYLVAGLAATLIAIAQISGGFFANTIRRLFKKRTSALVAVAALSSLVLILLYITHNFYLALGLVFVWGFAFAAATPIRQSYLNSMIPKKQRATVLSFDSMMSNLGGIVVQPGLARVADVWSYGTSFAIGAMLQLAALPLLLASRRHARDADERQSNPAP
jgi:MFS family permease